MSERGWYGSKVQSSVNMKRSKQKVSKTDKIHNSVSSKMKLKIR